MYAIPILQRPILAFVAAVVTCCIYFFAVFAALSAFGPKGASQLHPLLHLTLLAAPAVLCGLFHFNVVRGSDLSNLRKWLQILAAALGAPLLGLTVVMWAWIFVTGESF
jgi:hypothetical protein